MSELVGSLHCVGMDDYDDGPELETEKALPGPAGKIAAAGSLIIEELESAIFGAGSRADKDPVGVLDKLADVIEAVREQVIGSPAEPRVHAVDAAQLLAREIPPREHLFAWKGAPLIATDALYLLAGLTRAGKGMISTALGVALATGRGWGSFIPAEPRNVVLLTIEDTERRIQDRVRRFLAGLGATAEDLRGRLKLIIRPRGGLKLDDPVQLNEVFGAILPTEPDLIVTDNLHRLMTGSELDDDAVRVLMEAMDEIRARSGAAVFVVHHWGKSSDGKASAHRSRGSSAIPGYVDAHLTVRREQSEPIVTLEHHDGRDDEDWALRFRLDRSDESEKWSYEVSEAEDGGVSGAAAGPRERVLKAVGQLWEARKSGVSAAAVEARTGLSRSSVNNQLQVLLELGAVRREGCNKSTLYFPST